MFDGIHHISIAVDDLDEARDFYAGLLELVETDRPPLPNPGCWFQVGETQLHLTLKVSGENGKNIPGTGAGETHFAFRGNDLESVKRRVGSAGIPIKDGINADLGMRQLFFRDPSGNLVEVFTAMEEI
jgi:catechol 2,3-dioxygenase-like lactoylglutathione lyase family enzyme